MGRRKSFNILPNNIRYSEKLESLRLQGYQGEELARKYNAYLSSHKLEDYISKFGLEEGTKKYNNFIFNRKLSSSTDRELLSKYFSEEEVERRINNRRKSIEKSAHNRSLKGYIEKYGEEDGTKRWKEINSRRSSSLPTLISKYGVEEGTKRWNKKIERYSKSHSLESYTNKYGPDKGYELWRKWIDSSRQTKENFISRYGEEEGLKRWEEFCKVNSKNLEKYRKDKPRESYNSTLEHYLKITNGDEDKARELLYERQSMTLKRFIEKYGEEEGTKRWAEYSKSKANSKEKFISRYGEEEGLRRWNSYIKKKSDQFSAQNIISTYGEEYYKNYLFKKVGYLLNSKGYSIISSELFDKVYEIIKDEYKGIYYKSLVNEEKHEYKFYIHDQYSKIIMPDFYVKDINKVVEFYGDYWHKNPKFYSDTDEGVKSTHDRDKLRLDRLINKYGVDVLVVWENEYRTDKEGTIKKIINFLKS